MNESNKNNVRPWDIFDTKIEKVSYDISSSRMTICKQCPEFIKAIKQCKKCGCIMNIKTKLPHAFCPLKKWNSIKI